MTGALRTSGTPPGLRQEHLDGSFSTLEQLGIHLPADAKQAVSSYILSANQQVAPTVAAMLQHHTVLKLQRQAHGLMVRAKVLHDANLTQVSMEQRQHIHAKFIAGPYVPKFGPKLTSVGTWVEEDDGDDGDGWADGDGDTTEQGSGDEGGGGGGGDGGEGGGEGGGDGYDSGFSFSAPVFTTPSGGTLSMCQVFWGIIALGSGGLAGGIAIADALGAAGSLTIAGAILTPPVLIGLLVILAAYAAWCYIWC